MNTEFTNNHIIQFIKAHLSYLLDTCTDDQKTDNNWLSDEINSCISKSIRQKIALLVPNDIVAVDTESDHIITFDNNGLVNVVYVDSQHEKQLRETNQGGYDDNDDSSL